MKLWTRSLVLCLSVAVGCETGPELAEVSGRVTVDGVPVPNARVTFTPLDGPQSFGTTDAEGRYELRYSDRRLGAVLGTHQVSVETYRIDRDERGEIVEFPETLPKKYNLETELTREVVAGSQKIDLELTRD